MACVGALRTFGAPAPLTLVVRPPPAMHMFEAPTDRLHKFAAIGGIVLALGGSAGALHQYNETGVQNAEFVGSVLKVVEVYNRFSVQAREQIARTEKLKSSMLSEQERAELSAESKRFKEQIPEFDKQFEEARALAGKQEAMTAHYYRMQAIWLVLAIGAIAVGGYVSYRGFKAWLTVPPDQR